MSLMTIICDEVNEITPKLDGQQTPIIELILDDVNLDKLMSELKHNFDTKTILDYFSDKDIEDYLLKGKV